MLNLQIQHVLPSLIRNHVLRRVLNQLDISINHHPSQKHVPLPIINLPIVPQNLTRNTKRKDQLMRVEQTSANILKNNLRDVLHQNLHPFLIIIALLTDLNDVVKQIDEVRE